MADDPSAADRNVEIWKIKKLIKSLEAARGYVNVFTWDLGCVNKFAGLNCRLNCTTGLLTSLLNVS